MGVTTPQHIEELLRTLAKALRAFQMYLPNNPMYHRAIQQVGDAFRPVWQSIDQLVLAVGETEFLWEDSVVYSQPARSESLAWMMYKDGMRFLTLRPGVEHSEIVTFLQVLGKARLLPSDAGDDLRTLLWEHDFNYIDTRFLEGVTEGDVEGLEAGTGFAAGVAPEPERTAREVRAEVEQQPQRQPGIVDLEDFDSTLYFLEPGEVEYVTREVEREYARDVRASAMTVLFDVFELQEDPAVRDEILGILEALFPNLLTHGEFRAAAAVLRDMRLLAQRAPRLTESQRQRLMAFEVRLSEPGILQQLLDSFEAAPMPPSPDDVGDLLKELNASALETLVRWIPRSPSGPIRELLEAAADRIAANHPQEMLRLLRTATAEALLGVIGIAERRQLQSAVPGLAEALGHAEVPIRRAAVSALAAIGTPGALTALDRALDDSERAVRLAAVREVGKRAFRGSLPRVEIVVHGRLNRGREMDLEERRAFYEAYAQIAGAAAVKTLEARLLPRGLFRRREPPEVRICAAFGLGKIPTPEAHAVLERASADPDPKVRNAVSRALKEITGT